MLSCFCWMMIVIEEREKRRRRWLENWTSRGITCTFPFPGSTHMIHVVCSEKQRILNKLLETNDLFILNGITYYYYIFITYYIVFSPDPFVNHPGGWTFFPFFLPCFKLNYFKKKKSIINGNDYTVWIFYSASSPQPDCKSSGVALGIPGINHLRMKEMRR